MPICLCCTTLTISMRYKSHSKRFLTEQNFRKDFDSFSADSREIHNTENSFSFEKHPIYRRSITLNLECFLIQRNFKNHSNITFWQFLKAKRHYFVIPMTSSNSKNAS
jgi:hypothetical protein